MKSNTSHYEPIWWINLVLLLCTLQYNDFSAIKTILYAQKKILTIIILISINIIYIYIYIYIYSMDKKFELIITVN